MPRRSLLVAVVDDDLAARKALQRLLSAHGYDVEVFASGPDFLDSLEQHPPDCVLLDLNMEPVSGLDVQTDLVRRGTSPPVIFITGVDDDVAQQRALKQGAVAYLHKPLTEKSLLDALDSIAR